MEKKDLDLVYILGSGSIWNNNEIKYSLRSVCKNLPHRKVFVIGEKCDWFSDNIIHIPAEDPYDLKPKNALYKLLIAVKDKRVSQDFILMNDDFFILKPLKEILPYNKGTLGKSIKNNPLHAGYYYDALIATRRYLHYIHDIPLSKCLDYSLHYPFIYNKAKLGKLLDEIKDLKTTLLLRALYGNVYNLGNFYKTDVKAKNPRQFIHIANNEDVLSTTDFIVKRRFFSSFISREFPNKCKYEV